MRYLRPVLLILALAGCNQISGADDFIFNHDEDTGTEDAGLDGGEDTDTSDSDSNDTDSDSSDTDSADSGLGG
jgi:hypothetical protein